MRSRRALVIVLVMGLIVLGGYIEAIAHASCAEPPLELVWSYPDAGATDVPTNAMLWILTSRGAAGVSVDGQPVPAGDLPGSFVPGTLQPATEYEVSVSAGNSGGSGADTVSFRFTTGDGPATFTPPDIPSPASTQSLVSSIDGRGLTASCIAALRAQDCFDTGQNSHLIFQTPARPLLWLIQRHSDLAGETPRVVLWPGDCGAPDVYVREGEPACYDLTAVNEVGASARGGPFCPSRSPGAAGCSLSGETAPGTSIMGLV